jgi:hypothetical protein
MSWRYVTSRDRPGTVWCSTFVNARAIGADKTYGDNLAAWCIANAKNLGVKYVIWYKRIWQPSSGCKSYGGDGTRRATTTTTSTYRSSSPDLYLGAQWPEPGLGPLRRKLTRRHP